MHAFVDLMDFASTPFVDALRAFLQSFRLPGEAQKIDRYMLKFAERYTAGNSGVFANADTAYILAFSVILLNTDAHNPQVKKPMSKPEFVKNNRGIDDGKDLPEELLSTIYDEINANEIRMKDEVEAAGPQTSTTGLANAIATVGRDLQREAYVWQSEGMASKTEVSCVLAATTGWADCWIAGSVPHDGSRSTTRSGSPDGAVLQRLAL